VFVKVVLTIVLAAGIPAATHFAVQSQSPTTPTTTQTPTSQKPTTQPQTPSSQTQSQTQTQGQTTQSPTQTQTGPPPPAVPAARRFTSDAGMIFSVIKPDKTADFEAVMAKVKEALGKSSDPKRKQMALTWRVFKGAEKMGENVVYVFFFDPPVKDEDYQVTAILGEAFPNELQDLWAKYQACFANPQSMLNLTTTTNMSPNAATVPK